MSRLVIWAVLVVVASGCATGQPCRLATKPVIRKQSIAWHLFDTSVLSQLEQGFNLVRVVRKAAGIPKPSVNLVDGHVPDSSFLTNRDIEALSPDAVKRGPTQPGQVAEPPFVITRLKTEGKTAGFFVTDAKGRRFLFKLDLVDYRELVTGAEVVTSKFLYALGYAVPSYEVVLVDVDDLQLSPELAHNAQADLSRLLASRVREERRPDGQRSEGVVRVSASRIIEGEILGPFSFKRHRDCAELRALKLAYAWVNNTDAKDHNTLLVWTGNQVKGFLIDFGSSLGADAAKGPKNPCEGWVNQVDLKEWTLELLTLGLRKTGCDPREQPWSPAVGLFSSRLDPIRWKPYEPNLAFEEITKADARWMAARLARFSRAQLEAAVAAGQYRDPRDAAWIVEVLEARRQAILNAYLTK